MDDERIQNFNKKLKEIPLKILQEKEAEQQKKNAKDFENLKSALENGNCYLCGHAISHFTTKKPCLHWLLKPKGFKKKHFPILYGNKSFRSINTYLRWVANTDKIAQNINDLIEEKDSSKFIEETIVYRGFEWSFSCSESDRTGHANAHKGSMPHYHFQMKEDGRVFINYNAFHIPFTDYDEYSFALEAGKFDLIKNFRSFDAGMQTLLDQIANTDDFLDHLRYSENKADAALSTEFFIEADPGTTISGDEIAELLEERRRTGVSLGKLAKKLKNVTIHAIASPGTGVPEIAKRSGGRRNAKKSPDTKER